MVKTAIAAWIAAAALAAQSAPPIRLMQTLPLAGVKGHFDHFGFDAKHGRLFATLQQQGIVQILDAKTAKITGVITGVGKHLDRK